MRTVVAGITVFFATASGVYADEPVRFASQLDKINYAIGVETARNFISNGITLKPDMLQKGVNDVVSGNHLLMSEKELRSVLISVQSDLRRKRSADKQAAEAEIKSKPALQNSSP